MRSPLKKKDVTAIIDRNKREAEGGEVVFSEDRRDFEYVAENIPCQKACPASTNIPGYIRSIHEKRYGEAYEQNRMANILPGVLGRICSRPCELACRHGEPDLGAPVNICHLKRAASDLKSPMHTIQESFYAPSGKSVGIVGAGPAGIAAAHDMAILGHAATLYEAQEKPGGMLMYGIPEFRLPREVCNLEIANILRLGVTLKTGVAVGRTISLEELIALHDAVLVTVGCQEPMNLNLPGEDLQGVYSGLDFVMRINKGERIPVGQKVAVIGGGYTAIDCARLAIRMGAAEVSVNVRKTEALMRIDAHEKIEAQKERVKIQSLVSPIRIAGEEGKVTGITFERTRLEFSKDGKGRDAITIPDSAFTLPVDTVIIAVGQNPDTRFANGKIKLNGKRIQTKKGTHETSLKKLFAAGDAVTGATNVITAIAEGRDAAREIDLFLAGESRIRKRVRIEAARQTDRSQEENFLKPSVMPTLEVSERLSRITREVEEGYDAAIAGEESRRCYLCDLKYVIDTSRCIYCSACIDVAPRDCIKIVAGCEKKENGSVGELIQTSIWSQGLAIAIDNKRCIRCGKCYEICPMRCIHVLKVELIEQRREA